MKKILVTGGTGFVGSHVLDALVKRRDINGEKLEIYATRRYHLSRRDKVLHLENFVTWIDCDLTDPISTNSLIEQIVPDEIFHMAAQSFVSPSWLHPTLYMNANYNATVNLLDAIRKFSPECRVLLPGSGEEYGKVDPTDLPITDRTLMQPVNPYAVTKIAQDLIGYVYFMSYGLNVIRLRTFNHEGPRREHYFGVASYAYQIAKIELGIQEPVLHVGEIEDKRNFTHVQDVVSAYQLAMQKAVPGKLYLVGSEAEDNIDTFRGVISKLLIKANLQTKVELIQDEKFVRPTAVPFLIAETHEFSELTGWTPTFSLDEILNDVLNYWRNRVKENPYL